MGETQKYKMAVPGPGHTEEEQNLHKSLIRDDDDETDREVEHAMATVPSTATAKRAKQEFVGYILFSRNYKLRIQKLR